MSNDDLTQTIKLILRQSDSIDGIYLHQLTDLAMELLNQVHNERAATITTGIGAELFQTLLRRYDAINRQENNARLQSLVDSVLSCVHHKIEELLSSLLTSSTFSESEQFILARLMELVMSILGDTENVKGVLLQSPLRLSVLIIWRNIIRESHDIHSKVSSLNMEYKNRLLAMSKNIIGKYYKLLSALNKLQLTLDAMSSIKSTLSDTLTLTTNILKHSRISFKVHLSKNIVEHFKLLRYPKLFTLHEVVDIFNLVASELDAQNKKVKALLSSPSEDMQSVQESFVRQHFLMNLLRPCIVIWRSTEHQIESKMNEEDPRIAVKRIQTSTLQKLLKCLESTLQCSVQGPIGTPHSAVLLFVEKYFESILQCEIANEMTIQILTWFQTQIDNANISSLCSVWSQFVAQLDIDNFDERIQIVRVLVMSNHFMTNCNDLNQLNECTRSISKYCCNVLVYCMEDDEVQIEAIRDIMRFCWSKAFHIGDNGKVQNVWREGVASVIIAMPFRYAHHYVDILIQSLQIAIIDANRGDHGLYMKCKLMVSVLMDIYVFALCDDTQQSQAFAASITDKFRGIWDDCHLSLYLWCEVYPWTYPMIRDKGREIIQFMISECGQSLQHIPNTACWKAQNALNSLGLILKHRMDIAKPAVSVICKMIRLVFEEKTFFKSECMERNSGNGMNSKQRMRMGTEWCINRESYAAIMRVYGPIGHCLDIQFRTRFLWHCLQMLVMVPALRVVFARHILPNVQWKMNEINKSNIDFAQQIECIRYCIIRCLSSDDDDVIRETLLALESFARHVPFDVALMVPTEMGRTLLNWAST